MLRENDPHLAIVPYNDENSKIFERLKQYLCEVIPYEIEVEHIGSTSVPGLGGRDVIDVLILIEKGLMSRVVSLLESKGFRYNPSASNPYEKLFLSGQYKYESNKEKHVHIHVTYPGSIEHREKVLFRDYLKRNPKEAKKYYEFKKKCMREANSNPSKYRELKDSYIKAILERARKS